MWKNKLILLLSLVVYPLLSGYTFPDDVPYVVINSNRGNNEKVVFASNMVEYLHITDTSIISSYSGNLVGYTNGDSNYTWTAYDLPTYRSGYNTYTLQITRVVETNLYPTDRSIIDKNYEVYLIALLGGIVVICMFKK